MLRLCDREGILVIDETPAVGLNIELNGPDGGSHNPLETWKHMKTAGHHRQVIRELIARDQNHPCVIAWSVANEPASQAPEAADYFRPLVELAKQLDPQHRPVTIVTYRGSNPESCQVADLCDILMLNRYYGWYDHRADLEAAAWLLKEELEGFHRRWPEKPIVMTEYGADTVAGFHSAVPRMFSEEYQTAFLETYEKVFDSLPFVAGEQVWNFADFATAEGVIRFGGNKKGVFTRDRQPKMAAWHLKERWTKMP
jgi:beta-glucuronidase